MTWLVALPAVVCLAVWTFALATGRLKAPKVDDLVADCFETLSRGRPVADVRCTACKSALPHDVLSFPGRELRERSVTCHACGASTSFSAFNSPLGRWSPVVRTIDGAAGLFLTVKGAPPPGRVDP